MDIKAGCNAFGQNFWILLASMQSSGLFLFFLFASSKLRVPLFAHWTQTMVSKLPKQIENLREAQFVYWLLRIEFRSSFSFSLMMKCDMIVNLVNSDSEIGKLAVVAAFLTSEDSLAFSVDGLLTSGQVFFAEVLTIFSYFLSNPLLCLIWIYRCIFIIPFHWDLLLISNDIIVTMFIKWKYGKSHDTHKLVV
jgi:hypothetical protein